MKSSYHLELFFLAQTQRSSKHEGHGICCEANGSKWRSHWVTVQSAGWEDDCAGKVACSTAMGQSWALANSGQQITGWSIMVLTIYMMVLIACSAFSLWWLAPTLAKMNNLLEMLKMISESRWGKGGTIVCEILMGDYTVVLAEQFLCFLTLESFICVQMLLEWQMNQTRGMTHKDGTSTVHFLILGLSFGFKESPFCRTDKVIDWCLLTR